MVKNEAEGRGVVRQYKPESEAEGLGVLRGAAVQA